MEPLKSFCTFLCIDRELLFTYVCTYVHLKCVYLLLFSSDNKTWAEDEVDEASQQSQQASDGAASSSSGGGAEGAQAGVGATDEEGNATGGSTDAGMETGVLTISH